MREKLLKATIKDVKNVKLAVITPTGGHHEIRGDSGQGKTTLLKAIAAAFEGLDPAFVREGADNAEIELVLSNMQIRRVIDRAGKEQLTVTDGNKPISKLSVANGLLEALWGKGFDPVAWVNLGEDIGKGTTENRRKQRDQLVMSLPMKATCEEILNALDSSEWRDVSTTSPIEQFGRLNLDGIDWTQHAYIVLSELAKRASQIYHDQINLDKRQAQNALDATPTVLDHPTCTREDAVAALEIVRTQYYGAEQAQSSRSGLVGRINILRQQIATAAPNVVERKKIEAGLSKRTEQHEAIASEITEQESLIGQLEAALRDARTKLQEMHQQRNEIANAINKYHAATAEADAQAARIADLERLEAELKDGGVTVDVAALKAQVDECEGIIKRIDQAATHQRRVDELATASDIESLWRCHIIPMLRDGVLNAKLSEMHLPVEGLRVEDDQILVDGKPLWVLGTSEQYVVGVKLGALLNRRLGFMPIDRGESIGRKELEAIYKACDELDVTAILTFVDADAVPGDGVTVMRDGEMVA